MIALNSNESTYELAYNFINKNYTANSINNKIKKDVIIAIEGALDNGCTYSEINYKIQNCNCINNEYNEFFNTIKSSNENILKSKKFYFHNQLRIVSKPPMRIFDANTGTIKKEKFTYYLEMKASYTIDDLIVYIKTKPALINTLINYNKLKGCIKFLLNKYNIDFLLFLIDTICVKYDTEKRKAKNIFEIDNYLDEAKTNYLMKINESLRNNTFKIVPKKRVLFE